MDEFWLSVASHNDGKKCFTSFFFCVDVEVVTFGVVDMTAGQTFALTNRCCVRCNSLLLMIALLLLPR